MALERHPDLVVFEGSGAALPPIASDRRVLVVSTHQDVELACGYLNAYRILISDLVVLNFAEPGKRLDQLRHAIAALRPDLPVIATSMRPRPLVSVAGKKVALFTTAPKAALRPLGEHLERAHGAEVVHVSGNLANRRELADELTRIDAELFLVELKAAAVDVVIEEAVARGCEVGLVDNELVPLEGEADLERALLELAQQARAKGRVG
jgi:cyclic 2,3-diphosphoglycerate synthetase